VSAHASTAQDAAAAIAVTSAIVLAAGNGDRFHNGRLSSKLLHPVRGEPLIFRTLRSAQAAGITAVTIVLGYRAEELRQVVVDGPFGDLSIRFVHNPDWHLENGTSVLAARAQHADRRFALLMGDHLFNPQSLCGLLAAAVDGNDLLLAVDRQPSPGIVADEATKVRLRGGRISEIGKNVEPYDALDTGMFVCAPPLFDALDEAIGTGDTTLTGGVRVLAARGVAGALDIGGAYWQDVDTIDDLRAAEAALAAAAADR
jgi:choline kinase